VTNRKRILIVEDEMMIAMLIEDMVQDLGYEPIGPAMTVDKAVALATAETLDAAILDVNLGDGAPSTPVAEALKSRGVPFLFATGYGSRGRPDAFEEAPVLQKPFSIDDLSGALSQLLA
jgi:DNA-binding response OmpR family regulator